MTKLRLRNFPKVTKLLSHVYRIQTPHSCSYPCVYNASVSHTSLRTSKSCWAGRHFKKRITSSENRREETLILGFLFLLLWINRYIYHVLTHAHTHTPQTHKMMCIRKVGLHVNNSSWRKSTLSIRRTNSEAFGNKEFMIWATVSSQSCFLLAELY